MALSSEDVNAIKALGQEHVPEIMMALVESKVLSPSEIAVRLQLQAPQVHRVLEALSKEGLVVRRERRPTPVQPWVFYSLSSRGQILARSIFKSARR